MHKDTGWRVGAGTGGNIETNRWDFRRTELQVRPHQGFATEEVAPHSERAFVSSGPATPLLAKPQAWAQDGKQACALRWELFDEPRGAEIEEAKAECASCLVREDCLEDALAEEGTLTAKARYTIRGGMTPPERAIEATERARLDGNNTDAA